MILLSSKRYVYHVYDHHRFYQVIRWSIVDVRVAFIRKLAILGDRDHLVTANYSPVLCSYLWGPLDLNP